MARKNGNRGTSQTTRVAAAPRQLTFSFVYTVHTALVTLQGENPVLKHLLGTLRFRQQVEHQAAHEIGVQAACLDWTKVALDPPVSMDMRVDAWKHAAKGSSTQPRVVLPLKELPTPPLNVDLSPPPHAVPTEPEVSIIDSMMEEMRMRMNTMEAKATAQDATNKRLDDKNTALGATIKAQGATIKALGATIKAQDATIAKLSESNEEAAKAYGKLSAAMEDLQKSNAAQQQYIAVLMPRTLHIIYRQMLEWYREIQFNRVGRVEGDSTKDLIDRVLTRSPTELNYWMVEQYSWLSGQFHARPTEEEARIVLDYGDTHYHEIFAVLFPTSKSGNEEKLAQLVETTTKRASRDSEHPNSRRTKAKNDRDGDAFSDMEDDADDEEIDAYAQELAEGIMEDGNHDDEDPDMADWSDSDGEEEPTLEGEDEDMPEFAAPEEDSDEENDVEIDAEDEGSDSAGEEEEDAFDFSVMGGPDDDDEVLQEELQELEAKRKKQTPPKAGDKRKSMFASADDYDQIVKEAMAKQTKDTKGKKAKKPRRS